MLDDTERSFFWSRVIGEEPHEYLLPVRNAHESRAVWTESKPPRILRLENTRLEKGIMALKIRRPLSEHELIHSDAALQCGALDATNGDPNTLASFMYGYAGRVPGSLRSVGFENTASQA